MGKKNEGGTFSPHSPGASLLSEAGPICPPLYSATTSEPLERSLLIRQVQRPVTARFALASEREWTINPSGIQLPSVYEMVSYQRCPSVPDKSSLKIQERSAAWPDLFLVHPSGMGIKTSAGPCQHQAPCEKAFCSFPPFERIATGRRLPFSETGCNPRLPPGRRWRSRKLGRKGQGVQTALGGGGSLLGTSTPSTFASLLYCAVPF